MKKILEILKDELGQGFAASGYDEKYGVVSLSNRPDLCQYQCNGAMMAAKEYHKAPIMIANDVVAKLEGNAAFKEINAVAPGFINITLSDAFVSDYVNEMKESRNFGCNKPEKPMTIIVDYGGPNIAKPLHVGHLRSACIGESVKRIGKFAGHNMIGDVHLGDWGLQMGLIITEMKKRQPDLCYFDPDYTGEYPTEPPFTMSELEEIYPYASAYSKEHEDYLAEARSNTFKLQKGDRGFTALWKHICNVSITDLKKNYEKLNVNFELWNGESDVESVIPELVAYLKDGGYAHISEGALVVDVKEETDTKEIPPCMILKSDGSAIYNTTDLGTIMERVRQYNPDAIKYVVDKRQDLYFEQVFRCARKSKMVRDDVELTFLGFGTMNGADGKPFKTRTGGVMRLEYLLEEVNEAVYKKIMENREVSPEEAKEIAQKVGIAAIKYGDLSNQASKDYVFDMERFTSFEGNTGPYILYTIVRIKSILNKYKELKPQAADVKIASARNDGETELLLQLCKFNEMIDNAFKENAPHKVCQYIYDLANAFNRFYHENKIISETDEEKQASWIALIKYTLEVLNQGIWLLGIEAPDRM
ncbi:MAG: arginine--tRNA ligase [Lachnospiraceae bacterium]|nr:arginine--tRNA ligase [Lachnospiraceae bacterium]